MSGTAARFTLDEDKARAWLGHAIAAYEATEGEALPESHLPEIGADYTPRDDETGGATAVLVSLAQAAGVLAGPGEILWDFSSDCDGPGYTWLLDLGGTGDYLRLADAHEELRHLGDRETAPGTDAALAVLRDAAAAGNSLMDRLDRHVAGKAGAR